MGPRDEAQAGRVDPSPVALLGLLATSLVLSASLYGYRFPGAALPRYALALTILATAAFAVCVAAALRGSGRGEARRTLRALPALAAASFAAMYHHLMLGDRCFSRVTLALSAASVALGVLAIRSRNALGWFTASLALVLVVNTAVLLPRVPMLESGGDMLNLIVGGVDRALAGRNPYVDLRVGDGGGLEYSSRPLTYLPFLWLAYLPPRAAGWDIRWVTIVALLATVALFAGTGRSGAGDGAAFGRAAACAAVAVTPLVLVRATSIQTPVWWALLMTLCFLLVRRAPPWALGVVLGLIGLTRESAAVLAPLFAVAVLRLHGGRGVVRFLAVAAAVVAAGVAPFLIADRAAFVSSVMYNVAYAGRFELERGIPLTHVGFGGWLARAGWGPAAATLQLAATVAATWWAWRRAIPLEGLFVTAGALYFAFMLCNGVIHEYYYVPSLLLVGLGATMPPSSEARVDDGAD